MKIFDHEGIVRTVLAQGKMATISIGGTLVHPLLFYMEPNAKKHKAKDFEKALLEKEKHILSLFPKTYTVTVLMYEDQYTDCREEGNTMFAAVGIIAVHKDNDQYMTYNESNGITASRISCSR